MMKRTFITALLLNLASIASLYATGIQYETGLSWKTIEEKARKEGKYIFVDVGATWCTPCHIMDDNVLSQANVGEYFNSKFINVKVQADKTGKDDDAIKNWYADAENILKTYSIGAYPSYLYLSPDGNLVYRAVGVMSSNEFLLAANMAFDPKMNITVQKLLFARKEMELEAEGNFATQLYKMGDYLAADSVARDYKARYLENASTEILETPENLKFMMQFQKLIDLNDHCFKIFLNSGKEIDDLLKIKGFSDDFMNGVIINVLVRTQLYDHKGKPFTNIPEWNKIGNDITKQFSAERAHYIVLCEKYLFYSMIKDWNNTCQTGIDLIENLSSNKSPLLSEMVNQVAYNGLFLHSNNKEQLKRALKWMIPILKNDPGNFAMMDTYSCILYKLDRKDEALVAENHAIHALQLSQYKQTDKDYFLEVFKDNIEKMKSGKTTW